MKIFILLFYFFFAFTFFCFAQTKLPSKANKCNFTLKDAPVLRGLKLGMSEDEILKFFDVSEKKDLVPSFKRNSNLDSYIDVSSSVYEKRKEFKDVSKLIIIMFDKKLYLIHLQYACDSVSFENAQQFAKNISEKFNLPFSAWDYRDKIKGDLRCKEFEIGINSSSNELALMDKISEQRKKDIEEEKRKDFKP